MVTSVPAGEYVDEFEKNHKHHHPPTRTKGMRKLEGSAYENADELEEN